MNRIISWRTGAALGIAVAIASATGIAVSSAQSGPQALPNLQTPQQDQGYDRANPREYGGQSDFRNGRDFGSPQDRLDRRLAFYHTRLRITPAQERAWTDFTAVVKDEARERNNDRGRDFDDRRGPVSVLDRLEERQHRLADHSADLNRVIQAMRPLYASFSEDQKRTADRLMFMAERRGEHMRGERYGSRGRFAEGQDYSR
ncbi:MAG TPA: Spy/CpxP family protein refolding chaperone [Micropepsaceae bacterium]|jgi:hypothetical protein|nr:Spy/CpxP family protein refolding chaperone [Micropepsaceae bacterium]